MNNFEVAKIFNQEQLLNNMQLAIEQAQLAAEADEVPIGAVVVQVEGLSNSEATNTSKPHKNHKSDTAGQVKFNVVSVAHNMRERTCDPAGHAEFLAIKEASDKLGRWRLNDCVVFVTLEPCIMCAGLMHQARIAGCVYGAPDKKAGAVGTLYNVHSDNRLNHNFDVLGGVAQKECVALLQSFFKSRR